MRIVEVDGREGETYSFAESSVDFGLFVRRRYAHLLESVIKDVVKCEEMVSSSLTAFDLFYRKVSRR